MKLKFSIHYSTQWGQSLHVAVSYRSDDGRARNYLLPMQTDDGETWTLETSVMESRQRPIVSVEYHYQLLDGEGHLLRREWCQVPRLYAFDSTRDYFFLDFWRDAPLQSHLYSEAFHVTTSQARHTEVVAQRLPLFRRTVVFRVSAPQLKDGEAVAICGSHPSLGSWSPSRFLRMTPIGDGDWILSANIEGVSLPLEYKYVVVDEKTHQLKTWEEGDNRTTMVDSVADGQVLVLYRENLRVAESTWRAAGVAIPVFSLRSRHSFGVGDFGDLRRMATWCGSVGMKVLQLLPVYDTTSTHSWTDSHPYNAISVHALHPHYLDLEALGTLDDERMRSYRRQQRELNALEYSDYLAVDRVKAAYVDEIFASQGEKTLQTESFQHFVEENKAWLYPYAAFCILRDQYHTARYTDWQEYAVYDEGKTSELLRTNAHACQKICYVQYHLHRQLEEAAQEAHRQGVALMGDLPIGVYRDSVETWVHPEYFDLDAQIGTPPDQDSYVGQNWGFPPYRWDDEQSETSPRHGIMAWFRRRLGRMSHYFDALRIDHTVGYFRIWEIPANAVLANMGHYSPALPLSEEEIGRYGLTFHHDLYTRPYINDRIIDRIFGIHAQYVREHFLDKRSYGLYALRDGYDTQVKVRNAFGAKNDENSLWIRDGLYRLIANVLFLEDPHHPGMYHPRYMVYNEPVYEVLSAEEKDAFMRLYNNYFYERHNGFWGERATRLLSEMLSEQRMLLCAEDLGQLPGCVADVLDYLRILTLEIQSLPKSFGMEFGHLEANPYRSVCTISTHDMAPLRLWWEENIGRAQRYYATMLQHIGRAPRQLPAHLAEEIVARHAYCPSMLCLLTLQDWLSMDVELRGRNVEDERVNSPYDPYNQWRYRMPCEIERLMEANKYNHKLRTMITRSKR